MSRLYKQTVFVLFSSVFVSSCSGVSNPFRIVDRSDNRKPNTFAYPENGVTPTGNLDNLAQFQPSKEYPYYTSQSGLLLNVTPPTVNRTLPYLSIRNQGKEDEFVEISVYDSQGKRMPIFPSEFPLPIGSAREIPLSKEKIIVARSSAPCQDEPKLASSVTKDPLEGLVTVHARGKRETLKRSFFLQQGNPYEGGGYNQIAPFCLDKDVTGTCRYRSDPDECFRWEWTAYATILNQGDHSKISSIPEGIFLSPGEHGRVRVYLTVSCCTPIVQFISTDPFYHTGVNSCVIDVRELEALHPGEIAAIVVAAVVLIIILIVVIILCCRRRRKETINVGMLPRTRSRSREVISRP